jgi:SAM-dependent methyltransferase
MDVNQRQKEFYDTKKKNFVTKIWSYFRNGVLNRIRKNIGIEKNIYELHKGWFGDLSGKKVLDLGCYEGNSLSLYLAQESKSYLGIDLSGKGISILSRRLEKITNARAEEMDFLSENFKEKDFDLIYAYGVLHHFRNVDELITRLQEKLNPEGIVVSYDPLKTSFPIKMIRTIYRPFQSDKDWEWPFSRNTYFKFEEAFDIMDRRGVLGKSKWAVFMQFLPLSERKRNEHAMKWHQEDWKKSQYSNASMFSCMHLSMLLKKHRNNK